MNKKEIKRTNRIKVSFTFGELILIKKRAKAVGRTPARYIREGIMGKEMKLKQFTPEEKQLYIEMTGISRNVNQIARHFNMGDPNYLDLHLTIKRLQSLIDKLTGNGS
jgi:hypothetical protein